MQHGSYTTSCGLFRISCHISTATNRLLMYVNHCVFLHVLFSRQILQSLTDANLNDAAFPFSTHKVNITKYSITDLPGYPASPGIVAYFLSRCDCSHTVEICTPIEQKMGVGGWG